MKRSEIAEISIRHTKANSFQKSGAKFWDNVNTNPLKPNDL
jgi:hypothetical protein